LNQASEGLCALAVLRPLSLPDQQWMNWTECKVMIHEEFGHIYMREVNEYSCKFTLVDNNGEN
jgi:hypothetical protein